MIVTSSANPRIKQIRKLLRERKERQQSGLFYIEGLRIVGEAVQVRADIEALVFSPQLLTSPFGNEIILQCRAEGIEVLEVNPEIFRDISIKERPQGIGAILRQRWNHIADIQPKVGDLWVALDSIADPGNLGTILRTNDAVGGRGVILLDHSTDPYDAGSWRASMGAIFSQMIARATLDEFAHWKKNQNIPVIGTSDKAKLDYQEAHYPDPLVLLMGSERQGLLQAHLWLCDQVVGIPMVGRSDSLNLSVATGIMLYEIYNQRRRR